MEGEGKARAESTPAEAAETAGMRGMGLMHFFWEGREEGGEGRGVRAGVESKGGESKGEKAREREAKEGFRGVGRVSEGGGGC